MTFLTFDLLEQSDSPCLEHCASARATCRCPGSLDACQHGTLPLGLPLSPWTSGAPCQPPTAQHGSERLSPAQNPGMLHPQPQKAFISQSLHHFFPEVDLARMKAPPTEPCLVSGYKVPFALQSPLGSQLDCSGPLFVLSVL